MRPGVNPHTRTLHAIMLPEAHTRGSAEWTSGILADAADLYGSGHSLAAVAARYGIDPQTVANRLHGAGVPVPSRPGRPPRHKRN